MGTITRYWPYGPHGTVGNNLRGIGDVWLDLNRRGVPVFYKGADGYGPIFELWELEDVYHAGNQACFRLTDKGGINWDVPDWSLSPEQAAKNHVKLTIEFLHFYFSTIPRISLSRRITYFSLSISTSFPRYFA